MTEWKRIAMFDGDRMRYTFSGTGWKNGPRWLRTEKGQNALAWAEQSTFATGADVARSIKRKYKWAEVKADGYKVYASPSTYQRLKQVGRV